MPLKFYNVATREKEVFKPYKQDLVRVYSCGPTIYWRAHIGNYSAYASWDILMRTLDYLGYKTKWVMNMTDVGHMTNDEDTADSSGEDKMEKAARRDGKTPWEIAEMYEAYFLGEYDKLHLKRPDVISRATEHIQQMIDMTEKLVEHGVAYEAPDGVYFHVPAWKKYGQFSKLPMDNILAGARIEINENKRDPRDFALWVKSVGKHANHIMQWDSPWGKGFPGWHIECSAMSTHYLGYNIDIHTGGIDHLFPHHECEIAQSEGAMSKSQQAHHDTFARFWLHRNFIQIDGTKMSKSKGNIYTTGDLIKKGYSYREIRMSLISMHYRKEGNFTFASLDQARKNLERIDETIRRLTGLADRLRADESVSKQWSDALQTVNTQFIDNIEDDLNTPGCLGIIFEFLTQVNRSIDTGLLNGKEAKATLGWFSSIDSILGILPDKWPDNSQVSDVIPQEVQDLAENRLQAKKEKDFASADKIRKDIEALGYTVIDEKDSYRITKI